MRKNFLKLSILFLWFVPNVVFAAAITYSKTKCGSIGDVPTKLFELSSFAMKLVEVAVPVILVLIGSIDLLKGISSQKEEEIKKGQQILVKRLILAFVIFFVVAITRLLVSLVTSSNESDSISACIDCFVNGVDSSGKCRK